MQNNPQKLESTGALCAQNVHEKTLSCSVGNVAFNGSALPSWQRARPRRALSWVVLVLWFALGVGNRVCAEELKMGTSAPSNSALTQELRAALIWQTAEAVQARLGAAMAERGPIGTHASYSLWVYEEVVVAFANGRVIHVFDKRVWEQHSSQTSE